MHRRGSENLQGGVVVQNLLDCVPPGLHKEVVHQRGLRSRSSAGARRRIAPAPAMAVPGLQPPQGRAPQVILVLVREGRRAAIPAWATALLLWADLVSSSTGQNAVRVQLSFS